MKINNKEFQQKYHNFSISMKQKIAHTISTLKTQKELHHLLEIIIDAKTEEELIEKLKDIH